MKPDRWLATHFELGRGGKEANVRPMEGLRGVAVFLVFLVHYVGLSHPWIAGNESLAGLAEHVHTIGNTGVDLFFVLSGYLIYGSLVRREQPFLPFMRRRIERIYPTFTVVFLAYVALSFIFPAERKIPPGFGDAALYLLSNYLLLPGILPMEPMITVAWSLSYEMFYYLVMPLVVSGFALRSRTTRTRIAMFTIAAITFVWYCDTFGGPTRMVMFLSGVLLFEFLADADLTLIASWVGLPALIIGLGSTLLPYYGLSSMPLRALLLFAGFGISCYAVFRFPNSGFARTLSWTPLRWLGNMSYSYYLLHGLALKAAFLVLSKVLPPDRIGASLFWPGLPLLFVVTVIPSAVLFLLVERPFSLRTASVSVTPSRHRAGTAPAA